MSIRYQRNFRTARNAALVWAAACLVCYAATYLCARNLSPVLAIASAVGGTVALLAALACADEALTWRRRDRSTRNQQDL